MAFTPLWLVLGGIPYYYFFNSPYLYDTSRLNRTVTKYVDFTKYNRISAATPRLILTATNVQTGEPAIFDSRVITYLIHFNFGMGESNKTLRKAIVTPYTLP